MSQPSTYRALTLTDASKPLTIERVALSCPPARGTVLVRVLSTPVLSYASHVFQQGNPRNYPYAKPLVPGPSSCVARVAAVPADAVRLEPGALVWVDATVVARDDAEAVILQGLFDGFSTASRKLMRDAFRDGSMAECAQAPLENVHVVDEQALLGPQRLRYEPSDLAFMSWLLVPYGGLRDVGLRVGETVIVAPATGPFGGAAVLVALAMGAGRVIAVGRNADALRQVKDGREDRVETVQITGDTDRDAAELLKFGPADVYFDISPPQAAASTHLGSAFRALKRGARVSLMGGLMTDVALPHAIIMHKDITIKGKWMYPREAIPELFRMVELGILKIGPAAGIKAERYGLENWRDAFKAAEDSKFGRYVVLNP